MKRYELKRIGVKSCFRLFGGIFMVLGMILGISASMAGMPLLQYTPLRFLPVFGIPLAAKVLIALALGVFFGVLYGVASGVVYAAGAIIYNFFAKIFGGVKMQLEEKE